MKDFSFYFRKRELGLKKLSMNALYHSGFALTKFSHHCLICDFFNYNGLGFRQTKNESFDLTSSSLKTLFSRWEKKKGHLLQEKMFNKKNIFPVFLRVNNKVYYPEYCVFVIFHQ